MTFTNRKCETQSKLGNLVYKLPLTEVFNQVFFVDLKAIFKFILLILHLNFQYAFNLRRFFKLNYGIENHDYKSKSYENFQKDY